MRYADVKSQRKLIRGSMPAEHRLNIIGFHGPWKLAITHETAVSLLSFDLSDGCAVNYQAMLELAIATEVGLKARQGEFRSFFRLTHDLIGPAKAFGSEMVTLDMRVPLIHTEDW